MTKLEPLTLYNTYKYTVWSDLAAHDMNGISATLRSVLMLSTRGHSDLLSVISNYNLNQIVINKKKSVLCYEIK